MRNIKKLELIKYRFIRINIKLLQRTITFKGNL